MSYINIILIFISLSYCHQKDNTISTNNILINNSSDKNFIQEEQEERYYVPKPSLSDKEVTTKISNLIDFKLGDSVKLNSPKIFLQISILFTLAQNSNYYIISSKKNVSDEDISNYLNKQRDAFYKKLGISEEEYINYSINNSENIQEFLAIDPEFAQLYEIIQSNVTD